MAQPKKKLSKTRSGKRRAHLALEKLFLIKCLHCSTPIPPHTICYNCGYYQGKKVIDLGKEKTRK